MKHSQEHALSTHCTFTQVITSWGVRELHARWAWLAHAHEQSTACTLEAAGLGQTVFITFTMCCMPLKSLPYTDEGAVYTGTHCVSVRQFCGV